MRAAHLMIIIGVLAVSACARGTPELRDLRTFSGQPEEFAIVPPKPLQTPEDIGALPPPTPGGSNRTDQRPLQDAVAVLGGNPARVTEGRGGAVPGADTGLIGAASRFGRDGNIRTTLAAEDEAFRQRRGRFTWQLIPENQYNRVYRSQALDPYLWLEQFRRANRRTPSAPPEGLERN
ncbi:DUF3035 domain-containing protein [Cognatishimia sp. F0-27]|uniref:DUF3035 domain-containing protein n=1 Tax=Cognatishimia sp. F0-27 TaxID=2816855 RepID=UPI001D0C03F4|nr:DUF3035 domain-containing protein [Cognatishimia sp. F0-27]MCC1492201.1 DUF3035 domain-containing protein [Cognatishimia sp. F0-27]